MKKVLILMIMVAICLSATVSFGASADSDIEYDEGTLIDYSRFKGTTLVVHNWGEYISDGDDDTIDVIKEFEKLTGANVVYKTYDSNEDMYSTISGGGVSVDIVIPSDYMIQRMIREDLLLKLDYSNIPNYRYINSDYKELYFDPDNEYSVPYAVGLVGIIYNKTVVEGTPDSWGLLWDEKYKGSIVTFNNPRDAFATAMFYEGIDVNTTNADDWKKAFEKLEEQNPILKGYVMDEIFDRLESGSAAIGTYYAGDFLTMYENNNDLAFYYPKEGTNIFIDSICIPKTSKQKELAELFINFMLDPTIAQATAEYICYATPNTAVMENEEYQEYISELHPDAYNILYGISSDVKTEYFKDLPPETLDLMQQYWTQLKTTNFNGLALYITAGVVALVIIAIVVYFAVRKKKRNAR